ncbi:putative signaling protein [Azorhizobium caulinodans ORS 571]|uniref:Putative signaling protein n=2 Tax=Azorhizobium caulinodans TaxID=7 RepID=A8ILU5_AZOC5|nr:putative signaling protein [Azorhizobium caulinodans ORS 571]
MTGVRASFRQGMTGRLAESARWRRLRFHAATVADEVDGRMASEKIEASGEAARASGQDQPQPMVQQALPYPVPDNEEARLAVLASYHLMDTPPEADFDRLAALAARVFDVPIVLVSLLGRDRQFFKASVGFPVCETSREVSFCAHAIMQDEILVIPDATRDPRFRANPLVLGPPFIRFYAGRPLIAPTGEKVGTVCLIDHEPRFRFTETDRHNLNDLAAMAVDRMELRRLDHARNISQARFENIAATSPDAIICMNAQGEIGFWNSSAERLFGHGAQDIHGRSCRILVPGHLRRAYDVLMERMRRGGGLGSALRTFEVTGRRRDGVEFPAECSLSIWRDGPNLSVGAIVRDVSDRRQNEERLFRLASRDTLTDLPNRSAWRQCLSQTLASEPGATVLMIDLDGFKEANDTLGHSAGDAVLKEVAGRLASSCHEALIVARLGGDEFVVLLAGNDEHRARVVAERVVAAVTDRYGVGERKVSIGASIGIAFYPAHGARGEDLISAADLALYRAKAGGKGCYEVFTPMLREVAIARRAFEEELRRAFENGEFELYYQPQVLTSRGQLMGAEALLRWNHPQRGLLTPVSFLDVLSHKPSAAEVGEWILNTALRQAAEWRVAVPGFRMGVNLFEAQFRSGRLMSTVRRALAESGLPPDALELEIVETILLQTDPATIRLLHDLRALGVGLAFDDYGTGFASLSLLKRYPVSRLKIDRSFLRNVNDAPRDAAIVKAVLFLGRAFGMSVIAEGVEDERQMAFLRENGCDEAQGYLFGRPMPAREFAARFILCDTPPGDCGPELRERARIGA